MRRWGKRIAIGLAALLGLVVLFATVVAVDGWQALGHRSQGERLERIKASPQWQNGVFENPQPLWNDGWGMVKGLMSASDHRTPNETPPVIFGNAARFSAPPVSGLRVTWFGHSTLLLEIDGRRILTDPVWAERTSPVTWLGPERWYAPPLKLDELPAIDAVLISHDHYDHLDYTTITAIKDWNTTFVVPLGVAAHLVGWGVPEARIVELDWWQSTSVDNLKIACTPARHASGRMLLDNNKTLWAGYAIMGEKHRVYFSGDTGLFPAMREIGERLGPFDLTMIEAGAYDPAWPDWHIGPEQAIVAHEWVRGRAFLPIHWGLFNLAYHGWTEPIERVLAAAAPRSITVLSPRPGQSIEPESPPAAERWWPDVPWKTAAERPVRSTKVK